MQKELLQLSNKMDKVNILLENIDVLTDDVYRDYFSEFDVTDPHCLALLESYHNTNRIKASMVRNYLIELMDDAEDVHDGIGELLNKFMEEDEEMNA